MYKQINPKKIIYPNFFKATKNTVKSNFCTWETKSEYSFLTNGKINV